MQALAISYVIGAALIAVLFGFSLPKVEEESYAEYVFALSVCAIIWPLLLVYCIWCVAIVAWEACDICGDD